MAKPEFQIGKEENGAYYFNLTTKNGQVIVSSNDYNSKQECLRGIELLVDFRSLRIEDFTHDNQFYFVIKLGAEVIATSKPYSSEGTIHNGKKAVYYCSRDAEVVDYTS